MAKEGQGSALDPLGPEAPDPHSLRIVGGNGEAKKSLTVAGFAEK